MTEIRAIDQVLADAERAAGLGDYAAAEALLREALALQESGLGAGHPDLANTLNNLAVVCERQGKTDDAERCYRRAYEIASGALPADHPFVATSLENLTAFRQARAVPDELPARGPSSPEPVVPATGNRLPLIGLGVVVLALAIYLAVRFASSGTGDVEIPPAPAATVVPPPSAGPEPASPSPAPPTTPPPASPPASPRAARATPSDLTVVSAELCREFSTSGGQWQCTPAGSAVGPGRLVFYTRVKSPVDTVIVHRWYRGDDLRQDGELQVRANLSAGYRTYSRHTIDANSTGRWRVELRTKDGRLLHEAHVDVR